MAPKKNPHGKDSIIAAKIEASEKVSIPAAETDQPWHKPKAGSVFPKKRRLVKSLMLKFIFNPDPHGKDSIIGAKTETWEKVVEKVTIPAAETDQPWHKPKAGSLFPKKRRLVKSLMLKFMFNPDPHGKGITIVAKTETWEKVVEKVTIPAAETDQPRHKPKVGSLFPKERRSIKSLMLKFIFNPGRVSDSRGRPPSG
ncbi:hypothetical protein FNV43_RR23107 [Rhamnella rubrinervis]|uniref:Uncharacterized protein n=1 Tax=Rhamnella rubrinervis TaxID=2594499 RepID=A0A8K0GVQ9_9ROSA|nr:hypothetical protein FNV43_RR23107 [Rhamnella rubrinervis]